MAGMFGGMKRLGRAGRGGMMGGIGSLGAGMIGGGLMGATLRKLRDRGGMNMPDKYGPPGKLPLAPMLGGQGAASLGPSPGMVSNFAGKAVRRGMGRGLGFVPYGRNVL